MKIKLLFAIILAIFLGNLRADEPSFNMKLTRKPVLKAQGNHVVPMKRLPLEQPADRAVKVVVQGINIDENAALNGGAIVAPPDPIGAAGPTQLLLVVNIAIEWSNKATGVQEHSESLTTFFASVSPISVFDPKVVFD